jgi:hypothetical protein
LLGFDVDITNALCEQMKVKCTIVKQDWDGMIPGLMARKFDAIISTMDITEERKKRIDFSEKYQHVPARFAAKSGTALELTGAFMKDKKIGVQRATSSSKTSWDMLVFFREINALFTLFCNIHCRDNGVKLTRHQTRDHAVPILLNDSTFHFHLFAQRIRDINIKAQQLTFFIDTGKRRIGTLNGYANFLPILNQSVSVSLYRPLIDTLIKSARSK